MSKDVLTRTDKSSADRTLNGIEYVHARAIRQCLKMRIPVTSIYLLT